METPKGVFSLHEGGVFVWLDTVMWLDSLSLLQNWRGHCGLCFVF